MSVLILYGRVMAIVMVVMGAQALAQTESLYSHRGDWVATMLATRSNVSRQDEVSKDDLRALWLRVQQDYPVETDWLNQDLGVSACEAWFTQRNNVKPEEQAIRHALGGLESAEEYAATLATLVDRRVRNSDDRWLRLYSKICQARRVQRLRPLLNRWPKLVFTKHYTLGGSHYAYTEDLSDTAYPERQPMNADYRMGASLCLLELRPDGAVSVETLYEAPEGIIRDPDVSVDGQRILFSCRKNNVDDDYHLHEMDVASRNVRQLTFGQGFADYEGAYLPDGDIIFNSTRCVQIVDCWWTDVSNLYRCNPDGEQIRRISFDQVHTNYPTVMEDGRVIYTRWEYNDRGQIYPQPLFQMNADGTAQTEFYGNNSWFPTAILHARGIPDTKKVACILSGHHSHQRGKLAIIDPTKGRQEAQGAQLIAPVRETPPDRIDAYGQNGEQFQYPYPLNDREFLVTFSPYGGERMYPKPYAVYFMDIDGNRELLASDPTISCNQAVPLAERKRPHLRPSQVDYAKTDGTYYVQDVYEGPGLAGVPRGEIEKLRVIALDYRVAGVRNNGNEGEAGGALISTPIAVGNGSWDPKTVLGEATVHEDGSAFFKVPARTPVYFQAVNKNGHVVQTMRSWSTLQPGEVFSCVGCHENKSLSPPIMQNNTLAIKHGPQALEPFHDVRGGFSFPKYVQPILDKHCVECHNDRDALYARLEIAPREEQTQGNGPKKAFSLRADTNEDAPAGRLWGDAYLALTNSASQDKEKRVTRMKGNPDDLVNWVSSQSRPDMLPPYHAGAARSQLMEMLAKGHGKTSLTRQEQDIIACWIDLAVPYCGDYTEAAAWTEEEHARYQRALAKRRLMEEMDRASIESVLRRE